MPPPKRRAHFRTASAIAEDLLRARWVGGLRKAGEDDLAATIDWLGLAGVEPDEEPLSRGRDLLLHYVKRICETYEESDGADKTAKVAAASLVRLLLRQDNDKDKLARVIRRDAAIAADHSISPDAVRHREDRLIAEIAQEVSEDLAARRLDVPQTVEAGVHRLAPIAADVRQLLHDGLCVTYAHVPAANPRDRRVIDSYYREMAMKLGNLIMIGTQLVEVGLRSPNLRRHEFQFVNLARNMVGYMFDESDDREYILEFVHNDGSKTWAEAADRLVSTDRGVELYERWVEWAGSCYPTCAFERTIDVNYMCSPHAFLTLLYDFEAGYIAVGYNALEIPGNEPVRHHQLEISSFG